MVKQNVSLVFRIQNIDETRNYSLQELNHNEFVGEKQKKVRRTLNYFEEYFLVFASALSGCVSVLEFCSLVGVQVGITSSAVRLKRFTITSRTINKYRQLPRKEKNIYNKIVPLAKIKLNMIKVLIFKAFINSYLIMMNSFSK